MNQYGGKFFIVDFKSYNGKVPYIITDLISKLNEINSEHFEGIFRKNGPRQEINSLCQQLDMNKIKDWKDEYSNALVLSCALKRFFAQHSKNDDTIIDKQMERILQEIYENYKDNEEERIIQYKFFFHKLCTDDTRKFTLALLLNYLHKISINSEKNLMHAANLSKVFYISLFPLFSSDDNKKNNDVDFGEDVKNSINVEILEDLINKGNLMMENLESEEIQKKIIMNDEDIQNFVFPEECMEKQKADGCSIY